MKIHHRGNVNDFFSPLVSRCGMPPLKHLLFQLTYRRLPFFRFSIHCEILVPFHLIVPELGTTSSAATIMAFMKNILSFSLNCTTLSNHYSKFFRKCLRQGFLSADVYSENLSNGKLGSIFELK